MTVVYKSDSVLSHNSSVCNVSCVSQEVLVWLTALQKELGGEVSDERMRDYIWNTLKSGRVKRASPPQTVVVISVNSFLIFTIRLFMINHTYSRIYAMVIFFLHGLMLQ